MAYYFDGYLRESGVAGTRNYIGIISSVICSSAVVREIAEKVPGTVPFVHANGCAQLGDDLKLTKNMLIGVASNPNIHSALIVGLGCETNQVSGLLKSAPTTKKVKGIGIQQLAGGGNTIEKGAAITSEWAAAAAQQARQRLPLSSLTIGILYVDLDEESLSILAPVISQVTDKLIDDGVNLIIGMSKTLEPAGGLLAKRMEDPVEREKLQKSSEGLQRLRWDDRRNGSATFNEFTEEHIRHAAREVELTGSRAISSILSYGEEPEKTGLHLMNTSSNLVESLSKMASSGCSAVLIVSSRGVLTGSVALPCITITAENEDSAFNELVDYSVAPDGADHAGNIIGLVQEVSSGKLTKLEELDLGEFSIPHLGTTY